MPAGGRGRLAPGDLLRLRPAVVMTHDNTSAVKERFDRLGAKRVVEPDRCVVALDHDVQNRSEDNLAKYAAIERFAREQGMRFHPAGSGIGHQLMLEALHVLPGMLAVAADSHANTYGALGALGTPIARSDAAGVWATGEIWWEMPEVVRVVLEGTLAPGVTGKDVILTLCALHPDDVFQRAVEFEGPGIAGLSMDDRITIANMTTEWGAIAGVFPVDAVTLAWIAERGQAPFRFRETVPDPSFAATITLDLGAVEPSVTGPDTLARTTPLREIARERVPIHKAYLVSCANGRLSDLEAAAAELRGRRCAPGVELYVSAASAAVQGEAERSGTWQALLDAGAIALPSGCGPCIGLGAGLLRAGETGISASNRNFRGRMGSKDARCYLASPAVVAASAVAGYIDGPVTSTRPALAPRVERHGALVSSDRQDTEGPPLGTLTGRLVVVLVDAIDTDALCPKELVYRDGASRDALAAGVLATVAPGLAAMLRPGDVLVAGSRFGVGSSREQAASALLAIGIAAVVASSISSVFRRNALNNGLPAVESPDLVAMLREWALGPLAVTGDTIAVDLERSTVTVRGHEVRSTPLPSVARALLAAG
ncbi:MAG TPA: aconitase family protein, partial [Candidatus Polarisedimenticolaceae bacterium]|nr:aconitase family protein [Candidatus Polarisedimenticolaceae bacterium]